MDSKRCRRAEADREWCLVHHDDFPEDRLACKTVEIGHVVPADVVSPVVQRNLDAQRKMRVMIFAAPDGRIH